MDGKMCYANRLKKKEKGKEKRKKEKKIERE